MYTNLEDAENLREMKELQEHILDVRMFFFFSHILCDLFFFFFFYLICSPCIEGSQDV